MLPGLLPFGTLDKGAHAPPDPVVVQVRGVQGPVHPVGRQVSSIFAYCSIVTVTVLEGI